MMIRWLYGVLKFRDMRITGLFPLNTMTSEACDQTASNLNIQHEQVSDTSVRYKPASTRGMFSEESHIALGLHGTTEPDLVASSVLLYKHTQDALDEAQRLPMESAGALDCASIGSLTKQNINAVTGRESLEEDVSHTVGVLQPTVSDVMVTPVAHQSSNEAVGTFVDNICSWRNAIIRESRMLIQDLCTRLHPSPPSSMSTGSVAADQIASDLNTQDVQVSNNSGMTQLATDEDSEYVSELHGVARVDSVASSGLVAAVGCQSSDSTRRRIAGSMLSLEHVVREPPSLETEDEEYAKVERKLDTTSYNSNSHSYAIDVSAIRIDPMQCIHPNAMVLMQQISEMADPDEQEGHSNLTSAAQNFMKWLHLSSDGHSIQLHIDLLPKISYPIMMREKAIQAIAMNSRDWSRKEWQTWYNSRALSDDHFKFAKEIWKNEVFKEGGHAEELAALRAENTRKSKETARLKERGIFHAHLQQTCVVRQLAFALLKYPSCQIFSIVTSLAVYFETQEYEKERKRAQKVDTENAEAMEEKKRQIVLKKKVHVLRSRLRQAKGRGHQCISGQLQQEFDEAIYNHGYGRVSSTGDILSRRGPPPLE